MFQSVWFEIGPQLSFCLCRSERPIVTEVMRPPSVHLVCPAWFLWCLLIYILYDRQQLAAGAGLHVTLWKWQEGFHWLLSTYLYVFLLRPPLPPSTTVPGPTGCFSTTLVMSDFGFSLFWSCGLQWNQPDHLKVEPSRFGLTTDRCWSSWHDILIVNQPEQMWSLPTFPIMQWEHLLDSTCLLNAHKLKHHVYL